MATQEGQVMVASSDKMWSTGEGNGKPLQYSCLEKPMNNIKRQKDMTLKYVYIWNPKKKNGTDVLIYKTEIVTDVENKFMVTKGIVERDKLGGWN